MKLRLVRFSSDTESTLGIIQDITDPKKPKFLCFTLEDQYQAKKVKGETRIPSGVYKIKMRTVGGWFNRLMAKFGAMHAGGALWLQDVPGFEYILIHYGNTDKDTDGCILTGDEVRQNVTKAGRLAGSVEAYERLYKHVSKSAIADDLTIEIVEIG